MEYDPEDEIIDSQHAELTALRQRVAGLEAELAAEREAVRVLAKEMAGWRCGGIRFMDNAPGYGPKSIGIQTLKYFDCPKNTDANPLAALAVLESST